MYSNLGLSFCETLPLRSYTTDLCLYGVEITLELKSHGVARRGENTAENTPRALDPAEMFYYFITTSSLLYSF